METYFVGKKVKQRKILDFDFVIDFALSMTRGSGKLYVLDGNTLAYRGGMEKEAGASGGGAPQTVWDWAKNYTESPKIGKEFRFKKVRYESFVPLYVRS
jgi:hypothetical protein